MIEMTLTAALDVDAEKPPLASSLRKPTGIDTSCGTLWRKEKHGNTDEKKTNVF